MRPGRARQSVAELGRARQAAKLCQPAGAKLPASKPVCQSSGLPAFLPEAVYAGVDFRCPK